MTQAAADAAPPIDSGRYRLVARVGAGGMAVVYRAWDQRLRVWRAIKVLGPAAAVHPSLRARFEGEAQAMARLRHRHVLVVHDIGFDGDRPFLVMDLAAGSLEARIRETGPVSAAWACGALADVLDALDLAHAQGVVHRDLKPANLLVDHDGALLLADFGIAHLHDAELTHAGAMIGTRGFMAPEQARDAATVDGRADVYAAAATLAAVLTGRAPPDPDPDDHALADLPAVLRPIVARAMAADRDRRTPTAAALRDELLAIVDHLPDGATAWTVAPDAPRPSAPPPPSGSPAPHAADPRGDGPPQVTWAGDPYTVEQPRSSPEPQASPGPRRVPRPRVALILVALGAVTAAVIWRGRAAEPAPSGWGEPRQLTTFAPTVGPTDLAVDAEGRWAFYPLQGTVWRMDLAAGGPPVSTGIGVEDGGGFDVLPDGSALVLGHQERDLELVPLDGGPPRGLGRPGIRPVASPDARSLLYTTKVGELAVVDLADTSQGRPLSTASNAISGPPAWSPDSRRIAYVSLEPQGARLKLLDLGGGERMIPVDRRAVLANGVALVAWEDTGHVLLMQNSEDREDTLLVRHDLVSGEALPVATFPFDGVTNARLIGRQWMVAGSNTQRDVWIAEASGDALVDARRLTLDERHEEEPVGWTPEGEVVFASGITTFDLWVQAIDTPVGRLVATGSRQGPGVIPGGLLLPGDADLPPTLLPFHPPQPVAAPDRPVKTRVRCAAAASACVLAEWRGDFSSFQTLDPVTGHREEFARHVGEPSARWALSPDGRRLVVATRSSHLLVHDVGPGEWTSVEFPGLDAIQTAAWRTDAPGWWCVDGTGGDTWKVRALRPDGTHAVAMDVGGGWISAIEPSPDGRHVALGRWDWDLDLWAVERR